MKTISCMTRKGGCGKTLTAHQIGQGLELCGIRVLYLDLDDSGDLTRLITRKYDVHHLSDKARTLFDLYTGLPIKSCIIRKGDKSGILASDGRMAQITDRYMYKRLSETERNFDISSSMFLRDKLRELDDLYDVCIIDVRASYTTGYLQALNACDVVYPVVIPDADSLRAVFDLTNLIKSYNDVQKTNIKIGRVIMNRFSAGDKADLEYYTQQLNNNDMKTFSPLPDDKTLVKACKQRIENLYQLSVRKHLSIRYAELVAGIIEDLGIPVDANHVKRLFKKFIQEV